MPCSNGEESGSGALRTRDAADVALVLLNPPILLLVMWAAKRMTGLSYAYLIYDMYPGFPVALDIIPEDRLLVRGWERVMQMVYRDADRIVILGDAVKRRLASTMGRDSAFSTKKAERIPNWEVGPFIAPRPTCENPFALEEGLTGSFALLCSGNIGRSTSRPSSPASDFRLAHSALRGCGRAESLLRVLLELL